MEESTLARSLFARIDSDVSQVVSLSDPSRYRLAAGSDALADSEFDFFHGLDHLDYVLDDRNDNRDDRRYFVVFNVNLDFDLNFDDGQRS